MKVGFNFTGTAEIGGSPQLDCQWTVTSIDHYNFGFSQVLSLGGETLEESSGNGTCHEIEESGVYVVKFQDDVNNFTGNFDSNSGKFTGEAKQKYGSSTGSFDLQLNVTTA